MLALSIENLHKTYANGVQALNGVDLAVEEGDFFALLGPNGAGKTTVIGIISSLVNKTSGTVKVFGHDIAQDLIGAKTCMGLVPQETNFGMFEKVIDIVLNQAGYYGIPRNIASLRAEQYLQQLGLWSKRNEMSRTLSGGMKRRLMIARALVHEPKMLILDEPTTGVDVELRRTTWDFLQEINRQGVTIILTTHNLEEAEHLCHGIAIIDQGRILEKSVMKDLLAQLDRETIVLDLKHEILARDLPVIPQAALTVLDANSIQINFPRTISLNSIFAALAEKNIMVYSMRNKTNRLEELFFQRLQRNKANDVGAKHAS